MINILKYNLNIRIRGIILFINYQSYAKNITNSIKVKYPC
jgi:hypothetical protein